MDNTPDSPFALLFRIDAGEISAIARVLATEANNPHDGFESEIVRPED